MICSDMMNIGVWLQHTDQEGVGRRERSQRLVVPDRDGMSGLVRYLRNFSLRAQTILKDASLQLAGLTNADAPDTLERR